MHNMTFGIFIGIAGACAILIDRYSYEGGIAYALLSSFVLWGMI